MAFDNNSMATTGSTNDYMMREKNIVLVQSKIPHLYFGNASVMVSLASTLTQAWLASPYVPLFSRFTNLILYFTITRTCSMLCVRRGLGETLWAGRQGRLQAVLLPAWVG